MSDSLYRKLTVSFLMVSLTSALLVIIFIRITSTNQLEQMVVEQERVRLMESLTSYYTQNNSWQGISDQWEQIYHQAVFTEPGENSLYMAVMKNKRASINKEDLFGVADSRGMVLVPVDLRYPSGTILPDQILQQGTPLFVGEERAATILNSNRHSSLAPLQAQFMQRLLTAITFGVFSALLVASLVGRRLAHTLTSPLGALNQAAQCITHGQFVQQVEVARDDELGELANTFNHMSKEIMRISQSRRQMAADIAHELGSPLMVISGYIEGFEDGTVSPTPGRFQLIRTEIEHLQCLVEDLRMLSLAEEGELPLHFQLMKPGKLLSQTADLFRQSAQKRQVNLVVDIQKDLPAIQVDGDRMTQILSNLVLNSLRYTPSNGSITLSAKYVDNMVDISVHDTGTGIDPEDLPFIFDRFRRVEKSPQLDGKQSGLGLAIVKALAELHGGSVVAESHPGRGTSIHVLIPC